jgi:hypothetical protein
MSRPDQRTSAPADAPGEWTRLEDYLDLGRLWRRAGPRHRRRLRPRTEPSAPRLLSLGMLPFVLLMAALALLTILFIIAAIPGKRYPERPPPPPESGTAPAGWLDG